VWPTPATTSRAPEPLPLEEPLRETPVPDVTGTRVVVPLEVGPTVATVPVTFEPVPEVPVTETTGVPVALVATVPGLVTGPVVLTTVVTVPTGLPEPEPLLLPLPPPLPAPVTPPPLMATGAGVATTGVAGADGVGAGGVGGGVVPAPALVVPLPPVGAPDDPELRLGLADTGREIEAEPEPRADSRTGLMRVPTPASTGPAMADGLVVATAGCKEPVGFTTATAARPWEARDPAFGCAVTVCVAGEPMPASLGHPL
jgi:hypothetical protein